MSVSGVMQQLVLASGSDDDMGSLLGLLHSAPATELQLKIDILKVMEGLEHLMCHCIFPFPIFSVQKVEQGPDSIIYKDL